MDANKRVADLIASLEGLLVERRVRRSPVEPLSHASELLKALKALSAGDEQPIKVLLGLTNARPGTPGVSDDKKFELLRRYRELRGQGVTHFNAAVAIGIDQRTVTRWRGSALGIAEEVDARRSGLNALRSRTRRGNTGT
jgi:hypothetical protein